MARIIRARRRFRVDTERAFRLRLRLLTWRRIARSLGSLRLPDGRIVVVSCSSNKRWVKQELSNARIAITVICPVTLGVGFRHESLLTAFWGLFMFRYTRSIVFAFLALFSVLNGCNCEEELVKVPRPQIDLLDVVAERSVRQGLTEIAVPATSVGSSKEHALSLLSTGVGRVFVESVTVESSIDERCPQSSVDAFRIEPFEGYLAEGETAPVLLTFTPVMGGDNCADLVLISSDRETPEMRVLIRAIGDAPRLCVVPNPIDFGQVYNGNHKDLDVLLSNCGTLPLDISELALDEAGDPVFGVHDAATPYAQMAPGAEVSLRVRFTPDAERLFTGRLLVTSNDPRDAQGPIAVPLTGQGIAAPGCRISVSPEAINFGAVPGGNSTERVLIVKNVGALDCAVRDMLGPLGSGGDEYTVEGAPEFPVTLRGTAEGADLNPEPRPTLDGFELRVVYHSPEREDALAARARLEFEFDDNELAMGNVITVDLEAEGGGSPICRLQVLPQGGGLLGQFNRRYGVLQFGQVLVGEEKILPIRVVNTGSTLCEIMGMNYDPVQTPDREFSILGNHDGVIIAPGEEYRIEVMFAPTHLAGTDSGTYQPIRTPPGGDIICRLAGQQALAICGNGVTVRTDAPHEFPGGGDPAGVFSIGFSGTPATPDIDVIPGTLEFGLETVGCGSEERRVTVYNTGNADLTVNAIAIDPGSDPEFRISRAPRTPLVLGPDQNFEVRVRFFPARVGNLEGLLVIQNNDGDEQNFTVPLIGEGTLDTHQRDVFEQADEPMVDVLWVVDDSGSMSDVQNNLATNFAEFIRFATDQINVNFHIGVTTTLADTDMAGVYNACEEPRFLTRDTPGLQDKFRCNVRVSRNRNPRRDASDSREAGLEAARAFFRRDRLRDGGLNEGFLREEAKLYIIAVSDEEDQSRGPVGLYEDAFRAIKGVRNRDLISFSAIVGHGNGRDCEAANGQRYRSLAGTLNGLDQDICDGNWSGTMRALGLDTFAYRTSFALSRRPAEQSLVVTVDGQPVNRGQQGGQNGWYYAREDNVVVFNPGSVPARGEQIVVEYDTLCAQ
jgi:hypothetical protein